MPGVPFSPFPSQPSPPAPAVEGTPVSQPLLQGDIPARDQDSPAQPGNGMGGVSAVEFWGLEPPALLTGLLLAPHCGLSSLCSGQKWNFFRDPHPALVPAGDTGGGSSSGSSSAEEDEEEPDSARSSHDAEQVGWGLEGLVGLYRIGVGLFGIWGAGDLGFGGDVWGLWSCRVLRGL